MMQREKVDSSSIKTIGYDPETKELHVDFHKSGRYVYHNVPQSTYEEFMQSDSKGKFLHAYVKGQHEHQKL